RRPSGRRRLRPPAPSRPGPEPPPPAAFGVARHGPRGTGGSQSRFVGVLVPTFPPLLVLLRPTGPGRSGLSVRGRTDLVLWFSHCSSVAVFAGLPTSDFRLEVPWELAEIGFPLLQKGVASLLGFVSHVRQPGRLSGEDLLTDQAIVYAVESELQHPLGGGGLGRDLLGPLESGRLELGMEYDGVDHPHRVCFLGAVVPSQKEDLPGTLLSHHSSEVGGAVSRIEGGDVGVGLLEDG